MNSQKTMTISDISHILNGEVIGDSSKTITGLGKIESANESEITFLSNPKYHQFLSQSKAGAILISKKVDIDGLKNSTYIKVEDPYFAFVKLFSIYYPVEELLPNEISELSYIHPTAKIGKNVKIAPHVYIGPNCQIGDNVQLFPGVALLNNVKIGDESKLYPNVSVREDCEIGKRVILHNGGVIGSDGFGFAFQNGKYNKIPQMGKVVIEDDVELGANITVDRATLGETRISQGTKLDNLVQIAHNVQIGSHTVMAAQCGVSGSVKIGNYGMFGGQVGVAGHIEIGDKVQIAAQSGIPKSVPDGQILFGTPARPIMRTKRIEAVINNLPELSKKVASLQKELEHLKKELNK